jgi:hypothetical protein
MGAAVPVAGGAATSGLPSDDTHELGGDAVDDDDEDTRRGDVVVLLPSPPGRAIVDGPPPLALNRPSLGNSSFDALPLFLLILACRRSGSGHEDVSIRTHNLQDATVHWTTCITLSIGPKD